MVTPISNIYIEYLLSKPSIYYSNTTKEVNIEANTSSRSNTNLTNIIIINIKKPACLNSNISSSKNYIYITYYTEFKLNNRLYLYLSKYLLKYNSIKKLKISKNNILVTTLYIIPVVIILEACIIKLNYN